MTNHNKKLEDLGNIIQILKKVNNTTKMEILFLTENNIAAFLVEFFLFPLGDAEIPKNQIQLINDMFSLFSNELNIVELTRSLINQQAIKIKNVPLFKKNINLLSENKHLSAFVSFIVNHSNLLVVHNTADFLNNLEFISKQKEEFFQNLDSILLESIIQKYNNNMYFLLGFLVKNPNKISKKIWFMTLQNNKKIKTDFIKLSKQIYKSNLDIFLNFFDASDFYDALYLFFNNGFVNIINREKLSDFMQQVSKKNKDYLKCFFIGSNAYPDLDEYLLQLPMIEEISDMRIQHKMKESRFFYKGRNYKVYNLTISPTDIILGKINLTQFIKDIYRVKIDFNKIFIHRDDYTIGCIFYKKKLYLFYSLDKKFDIVFFDDNFIIRTNNQIFGKNLNTFYTVQYKDNGYIKTAIDMPNLNKKLKTLNLEIQPQYIKYTNDKKECTVIDYRDLQIRNDEGVFVIKRDAEELTIENTIYNNSKLQPGKYITSIPITFDWSAIELENAEQFGILKKIFLVENNDEKAILFKTNKILCIQDVKSTLSTLQINNFVHEKDKHNFFSSDDITSYYFDYNKNQYRIICEKKNNKLHVLLFGKKTHWRLLSISYINNREIYSLNTNTLEIYHKTQNSAITKQNYNLRTKEIEECNTVREFLLSDLFDKIVLIEKDQEYNFVIEKGLNRIIIFKIDGQNIIVDRKN